jgi:hypothetical protein
MDGQTSIPPREIGLVASSHGFGWRLWNLGEDASREPDATYVRADVAADAVSGQQALIEALRELLASAEAVMDGLNARIDDASANSQRVPVFHGIAALHDAIGHSHAALHSASKQGDAK